jgi:uncharacterized membrane protein
MNSDQLETGDSAHGDGTPDGAGQSEMLAQARRRFRLGWISALVGGLLALAMLASLLIGLVEGAPDDLEGFRYALQCAIVPGLIIGAALLVLGIRYMRSAQRTADELDPTTAAAFQAHLRKLGQVLRTAGLVLVFLGVLAGLFLGVLGGGASGEHRGAIACAGPLLLFGLPTFVVGWLVLRRKQE